MQNADRLIWVDLEMTGLRPESDHILEVAVLVTDVRLELVASGPVLAIHQPEAVLAGMDEWNQTHHRQSGLLERVRASRLTEAQAEAAVLQFLREHVPPGASPICGNSICQDRRFLYRWMPELERYFHYRNLDVSSVKILAQCWKPEIMSGFVKNEKHLALDDILESIAELRYYREHLFQPCAKVGDAK